MNSKTINIILILCAILSLVKASNEDIGIGNYRQIFQEYANLKSDNPTLGDVDELTMNEISISPEQSSLQKALSNLITELSREHSKLDSQEIRKQSLKLKTMGLFQRFG